MTATHSHHDVTDAELHPNTLPETLMSDTARSVTVWIVDKGVCTMASVAEAFTAANAGAELVWLHYDLERGAQLAVEDCPFPIPEMARDALTAFETRPRSERIGNGAMLNLRGLGEVEQYNGDPLVSLRMWAEQNLLITASFRELFAMLRVREAMQTGNYHDAGDVIAALADAITEGLDPKVADLGDRLDDIESVLETAQRPMTIRRKVSRIRQMAISYRRFIAPQRVALERLQQMQLSWLDEDDQIKLRASADRCVASLLTRSAKCEEAFAICSDSRSPSSLSAVRIGTSRLVTVSWSGSRSSRNYSTMKVPIMRKRATIWTILAAQQASWTILHFTLSPITSARKTASSRALSN